MASPWAFDVDHLTVNDFGLTPGAGANREDLADFITIIDPVDTPAISGLLGESTATAVRHDWLESTLKDPKTARSQDGGNVTGLQGGAPEGADFDPFTRPIPTRPNNVLQIFRDEFVISRTQARVLTAGIRNKAGHETRLSMQEILRAMENRFFSVLFSAGTDLSTMSEGDSRLMKTFEGLIANNVTSLGTVGNPAAPTEDNILDLLMDIIDDGGRTTHIFTHHRQKRKFNRLLTGIGGAGTEAPVIRSASDPTRIPGSVRTYESDIGDISIVGDRWVTREDDEAQFDSGAITEANSVATGGLNEASAAGRVWLFQQGMLNIAWLDKPQVVDIAKRGDNVSVMVVAELTIEVLSDKAQGVLKRVAD